MAVDAQKLIIEDWRKQVDEWVRRTANESNSATSLSRTRSFRMCYLGSSYWICLHANSLRDKGQHSGTWTPLIATRNIFRRP
jgi:hypothetical protein